MPWQPFYEFKTGLNQQQWDALSAPGQHEALRGSGKHNRDQSVVQNNGDKEPSWLPTLLPVRVVAREELRKMPRFDLYW